MSIGRGRQVKTYELEKVETYAIRARNLDEAIEILNGLDNSSAYKVEVRGIYASGGEDNK